MNDKISIISDGTVKGTKIKLNNDEMTNKYKVTSVYFSAHGGYTYRSDYSDYKYVNPPRVSYDISYLDDGKQKSISASTQSVKTTYGALNQKDSLIGVGKEISDAVKDKILDSFDELREEDKKIPERKVLEARTIDSLIDKYVDTVSEFELKAKIKKEKEEKE